MSVDIAKYKEKLFSIQILDHGVSIFTEKFIDFLNIDDVLVFGFISALYSYTYAMGHEEVVSIDFGTSKFLFSELYDGKLLVIITKEDLLKGVETELIQNISLRYEILTENKSITEISSLFDIGDTIIPLDLVAEIRRKGQKKPEKASVYELQEEVEDLLLMPEISIPTVQMEEFYVEVLTDEEKLGEDKINSIKKSLTNFFLGYKRLTSSLFAVAKDDQLFSFVFSRRIFADIYPVIKYIMANPAEMSKDSSETTTIKSIQVESESYWVLIYMNKKQTTKSIVFSNFRDELESIAPHLSRISKFVERML
ncbi:MAG: hypothetical protein HeimAB125_02030 [Candidatus Heimdallarchaeota archaeon AB_125]|nr:MAG: hypothetical protein HeimAB125_02030 [Candidatus Heimdallarchaeota archaeon AB_125]